MAAAAERICTMLTRVGHRALLAGGCVRDRLRGVPPKDFDIATSATPIQVAALFEKTIPVGAAFGVMIVVLPEGHFEVATFRADGPYLDGRRPAYVNFRGEQEDAFRRDFTINAMFYDTAKREVVDYVGGRQDLEAKLIRTVGKPADRFSEDHLRLLRAVRFAARLGFDLDPDTYSAIRSMAGLIKTTSAERVREEIIKMLTEGGGRRAIELMDGTGLLHEVLPEIERMKDVPQPPEYHPEGDVYTHTLILADMLKGTTPSLAMATLLHDVGKPETITFEDRIRFSNHDKVGAEIAGKVCRRLRMSNEEIERVQWLVGQHMRLAHAPMMRPSKLKRFVREEGFSELLELGRMDCMSSHGDLSNIAWLEDYLRNAPEEVIRPVPLLTGDDLIAMGYAPGKAFKDVLCAVEDAQLEGTVQTRDAAIELVRAQFPL